MLITFSYDGVADSTILLTVEYLKPLSCLLTLFLFYNVSVKVVSYNVGELPPKYDFLKSATL